MNTNPLVLNGGLPITTALSASGPLNYAQAYFGVVSSWSTSSTGYNDPTNSGGNALTVRQSSGISLTAASSNNPGITFTPDSNSSVYFITATVNIGATGTGDYGVDMRMYDGSVVISNPTTNFGTATPASVSNNVTISGIYNPGTTSPVTVKLQIGINPSGSTAYIGSTPFTTFANGSSIEWTIIKLSNNGGSNGVTAWNTNLSVTPSGAFGSYSGLVTQSRIVGNNLECKVYLTAGTNSSTIMSLALPSGYIIDSSKLNSIGSFLNGNATSLSSPGLLILATSEFQSYPFYDGSDTANIYFTASTQSGAFVKQGGSNFVDSDTPWLCEFSVPIVGLFAAESNVSIIASAYLSTNQSASVNAPLIFDTVLFDTASAYNSSTGIWTAPYTGYYEFNGYVIATSGGPGIELYKNGSIYIVMGVGDPSQGGPFSTTVQANSGDTFYISNSGGGFTWNGGALGSSNPCYFTVNKV